MASVAADARAPVPLTTLPKGAHAEVAALADTSPHERGKLMAMGVIPGASLRVLQRYPAFVIAVGHTQLALDAETAGLVQVTEVSAR